MNKKNEKMQRSEPQTKRRMSFFAYFIVFLSLLLLISLVRNIARIKKAGEKITAAQQRVEDLEEEQEELKERIEEVNSQEFIEKQLRDKLGLAKEGEVIIVLPEEEVLRKLAPKPQIEEEMLPDPNWKKWAKLFELLN